MVNRRKMILSVCIIAALIIVGVIGVIYMMQMHLDTDIYIFADLSECQLLESLNNKDEKFIKYQDAALDDHIRDLKYTSFFGGEYSCDLYEFEIFAYEFSDAASAQSYFENATGKNSDDVDPNFSLVSGFMSSHIIAFNENKAYSIYFPTSAFSEISQLLAEHFTIKIN